MTDVNTGEFDFTFYQEDPHPIVKAQYREQDEAAFEGGGGFGNENILQDRHLSPSFDDPPVLRPSASLSPPALLPPKLTVNIIDGRAQEDVDDSDQEFEDVPLGAATPITLNGTHSIVPAIDVRARRSKKQPQTLNLNGLPMRLDENGTEIEYREAPPAEDTYAWVSDTPIAIEDAYFGKGCERRMVFESDPVPRERQYQTHEQSFVKKTGDVEFLNAVDKAYDWNRTRRGVIGATNETLRDGERDNSF